jgi:hypothetical protein
MHSWFERGRFARIDDGEAAGMRDHRVEVDLGNRIAAGCGKARLAAMRRDFSLSSRL